MKRNSYTSPKGHLKIDRKASSRKRLSLADQKLKLTYKPRKSKFLSSS